jgi:hypothetical protein
MEPLMPSSSKPRHIPTYRKHSERDKGFVELNGKRVYLPGAYDTAESREAYHREIHAWLARGRQPVAPPAWSISVAELCARFREHAEQHYRKPDGRPTTTVDNYRQALRPLRELYGHTPAIDFGPLALRLVRERMVGRGWCRPHINQQIDRIRYVFRWAVSLQLLPETTYRALATLAGLEAGRTDAREPEPKRPVPEPFIHAIKPYGPASCCPCAWLTSTPRGGPGPTAPVITRTRTAATSGRS